MLPDLNAKTVSSCVTESLDSVAELPRSVGQQLQHLVKGRPRRAKTRAPTRPMLRPADSTDTSDLGEGLDTFFRPGSVTPTTPLVSPTSDDSRYISYTVYFIYNFISWISSRVMTYVLLSTIRSSHTFPIESEVESLDGDRERRNGGIGILKDKAIKR